MTEINRILEPISLPEVAKVRQHFQSRRCEDPVGEARRELERCNPVIHKGDRIAITAGSRGIDQYVPILKVIVDYVKERGGRPFLVPSMGSHGGATAEGQKELLRRYGVTEETVGAPILSSMETVQVGVTDHGLGVYIDKNASEADGIIVYNRVKPHTAFRGKYESGLLKMLAIGLAKQKGAEATHFLRYENMAENIVKVGTIDIEHLNIVAGVCTIENGYGKVMEVHACRKEEILEKEPGWLETAWTGMPRLALPTIDVLIVGAIGKEISGAGMDTNIIGRFHSDAAYGGPKTIKLGCLNVTDQSHGTATGVGMADFIPKRMFDRIDLESTYINSLTNTEPNCTRIPMILDNDRRVLQACVKLCGQVQLEQVRMVLIQDTKHMEDVYMSRAAIEAADAPIDVLSDYFALPFDDEGNLQLF